jgi:hypothetical protein
MIHALHDWYDDDDDDDDDDEKEEKRLGTALLSFFLRSLPLALSCFTTLIDDDERGAMITQGV